MTRDQLILEGAISQRNKAFDALVEMAADLAIARAQVTTLSARVAELEVKTGE